MAALRVWDRELDLDAALDAALWWLPLLFLGWLLAWLLAGRAAPDPVAAGAAAAAAGVAAVNVVARRLRFRCPAGRAASFGLYPAGARARRSSGSARPPSN
ncbi:hypothetical protein BS78_04G075000 [Paspalum vaginatum]|nr:hypothetical protein BS78_04G075000 [Paspalum vaginatum]